MIICRKLLSELKQENFTLRKTKLLNLAFICGYLDNQELSNASIQEFEERIIKRMKRKNTNETDTELVDISIEDDYLENWDDLTQVNNSSELVIEDESEIVSIENLENAIIEVSDIESEDFLSLSEEELEQVDFPTVENYFLEGDRELTETLIEYCPKIDDEKYDVTCDPFNDTYYLASRKIVHLFIYQNELFKDIDLSADCLLEQKIDVKELRRLIELHIRKYTNWELSKKKINKFILCTLCHIIREYKRLGQLDLLTAIKAFFAFMGKIYHLPEEELKQTMEGVIRKLRLNEPKVIGEAKSTEPKQFSGLLKDIVSEKSSTLLDSFFGDKEDVEAFLLSIWEANPHHQTKTEEEIAEERRKAKRIVEERGLNIFIRSWEDNEEFRPYLAIEYLEARKRRNKTGSKETVISEEKMNKTKQKRREPQIISDIYKLSDEQLEFYQKQCNECMKAIGVAKCLEKTEIIEQTFEKEETAIQKLWNKNEDLRPCIANELLKRKT